MADFYHRLLDGTPIDRLSVLGYSNYLVLNKISSNINRPEYQSTISAKFELNVYEIFQGDFWA